MEAAGNAPIEPDPSPGLTAEEFPKPGPESPPIEQIGAASPESIWDGEIRIDNRLLQALPIAAAIALSVGITYLLVGSPVSPPISVPPGFKIVSISGEYQHPVPVGVLQIGERPGYVAPNDDTRPLAYERQPLPVNSGHKPRRIPQTHLGQVLLATLLLDFENFGQRVRSELARGIRHGHPVAPSTISRWLSEHPALTAYRRLRARGRRLFTPTQVIRAHKLYHRQVYDFALHRAKLAFLRNGSLDEKRAATAASTARFATLANFLESVPTACPHDLFRREDGARGSQLDPAFINGSDRLVVFERQNTATETAALILPSVGTNYERHPKLQRFMLANNSTTIAVEVPIWLHAEDIAAIERRWDIELFPKAATAPSEREARSITGHIDFLQIRNGAIHILDYKPDATTGKPFAQLTLYALPSPT